MNMRKLVSIAIIGWLLAVAADADVPLQSVTLKYPRVGYTATVLPDGTVAVIGGVSPDGKPVPQIEILDLANSEVRVAADPALAPRTHHSATLLTDGRVLLAGGESAPGVPRSDAQLWNPDTGAVETVAGGMVIARASHEAQLLADGSVLLRGGKDQQGAAPASAERFDVTTGRLSALSVSDEASLAALNSGSGGTSVAAIVPVENSTGAPVDTRIAIRLNRTSAPGEGAVTLVGPAGAIEGKFVVAESGRLLFFTPAADLLPDAAYTVFVRDPTSGSIATSTFRTQKLSGNVSATAARSTTGTFSLQTSTASSPAADAAAVAPRSGKSKTDGKEQPKKKPEQPAADDDDDDVEDWLPGPEHRHGNWRVIGLPREPHTKRQVVVPTQLAAAARTTALTGRVARLNGLPIENALVRVGNVSTRTDAHGRFLLNGLQQGSQVLFVDGSQVQRGGRTYLSHYLHVRVEKGKTTRLGDAIYLAREDRANAVSFPSPTDRDVVVTNPAIPGLELHIPKGAVLRTPDGKIVTRLSITPLPINRAPFPVPMGFPVYFAVQPAGVFVDNSSGGEVRGIRVLYPNFIDAPAGTRVVFWNYDPNGEGWQVYGGGTVSADGSKVIPDEGVKQPSLMAFGYGLENSGKDPKKGPKNCVKGDPVDCATGLFLHGAQDLLVNDTIPLSLFRTYRQDDQVSRDFGIGANHSFGLFLSNPTSDVNAPALLDLILGDGTRIRFNKIAGTSVNDVVFQHTATPSEYQGAQLRISTITHSWEMTLRTGTVLIFQPHTPNQLIGMRDRFGNTVTINRVGDLISQIVSPHGRTMTFAYDSQKRITQVNDNAGRTVRYQYDTSGRLWKVTDPVGNVEQYGYDTANRMTSVTDRRGHVMVTNVYDANGRVQQQTLADGAVWQFSYQLDAAGNVIQTNITDPRGFVEREKFNADGYMTEQTLALGQPEQRTTTYVREPTTNLLVSITDHLGRVTRYEHDYRGNTTSVTRLFGTPNAVTATFEYDPLYGQLVSYTDPLNHKTTFNHDPKGNLSSIVDPLNHVVSATYDSEGNVSSVTNPLGHTTQLQYDLGDLASITNPLGRTMSMFMDQVGRPTGYGDAAARSEQVTFDAADRVTRFVNALGQATVATYDENGNQRTLTDPRNLASHSYTYDVRDRLHVYTDPLGATETYEYDGMGNVLSKTDRKGQVTSFTYDPLNRVRTITYADSSTNTITWDDANRKVIVVDSVNGTITRTFDDLGRLTREAGPEGQVDYQYDAAGRRRQMTIAGVATPITYDYDDANRLTRIAQGATETLFGYDDAGRRTSSTLPNGVVSTWTYNDADEVTGINYDKGATHIGDLTYAYDNVGRRIGISGTLAKLVMPATVSSATYNVGNRLTNWGGQSLSYDNNGNLTGYGGTTYGWNARDELTSTSASSSTFSYDAMGRRRARTVGGVTTPYLHDGDNPVQVGGDVVLAGLELDEFYAQITAGIPTSYLHDALGSTLALTDSSGAVTAAYAYGVYGQISKTGSGSAAFQFTGRERDLPGLQFNRGRYYHPDLGRFISEDPIGLGGGVNVYAYVDGDPLSATDPEGEFGIPGALIGAGIDLGLQLLANGGRLDCVNWLQVGVAGAMGAVGGGAIAGAFKHTKTAKNWFQMSKNWGAVSRRVRSAQNTPGGQELHHWFIERNSKWGKKVPNWIKNHPWNLNPVDELAHDALHAMGPIQRTIVGAPSWAQAAGASAGGGGIMEALTGGGCGCD